MKVHEIMTREPASCTPDTPLQEVARMMKSTDCGQIPIVDATRGNRPVGVVTDRDIVVRAVAEGRDPRTLAAKDVMTSPAVTVSTDDTLEDCARALEDHRIRRVPVVDATGRCCGIVAQADLARRAPEDVTVSVLKRVSQSPSDRYEPARRGR